MKITLLIAIVAGLFAAGSSLYPQYRIGELRGAEYFGAYGTYDLDETAYAAYLQALIDGRPRKNDPYTARDEGEGSPQYESLFSIQFATAYLAAVPARALGLDAHRVMPVISVVSAFFTAAAVFWLAFTIGRDRWLAFAVSMCVIGGGALISGIGAIGEFHENGIAYPYIPFLRRHIPSLSFPFAFAFLACLWSGLNAARRSCRVVYAVLAAVCFAMLLFSYFYLWTSALAFLVVLAAAYLIFAATDRRRSAGFFAVVIGLVVAALVPYVLLLTGRSPNIDSVQLLVLTHKPELNRNIVIIGIATAVALVAIGRLVPAALSRAQAAFLGSAALVGPLVFNQQILTGRSLQPFHYEYYSANYFVLFAFAAAVGLLVRAALAERTRVSAAVFIVLSATAAGWGGFEAVASTRYWDDANIARDEGMEASRIIRRKAATGEIGHDAVTLNLDPLQADSQPTVAPAGVLWARHQHTFAGIRGHEENRARFYKLIYFSGLGAEWLRDSLTGCDYIDACMVLFGWDRFNATLSGSARPLTKREIDAEAERYAAFEANFAAAEAYEPLISHVVYRDDQGGDLTRLEEWYEVGPKEKAGRFIVRKLTRRQ